MDLTFHKNILYSCKLLWELDSIIDIGRAIGNRRWREIKTGTRADYAALHKQKE
jgi:hypothetical protein